MRDVLLLLTLVVTTLAGACSSSADAGDALSGGAGSGAAPGAAGAGEAPDSLAFLGGPEELSPRQELTLTVRTSPPGQYRVRFALPSSDEQDPLDAVLDRSEDETDAQGEARVVLIAPSASTSFRVRASIEGGITAERQLSVMDSGTATVLVQPLILGRRDPTTWVATARPGETCADRPGIPPPDGPYTGLASKERAPEIAGVPAGVPVAVTLRSGHFMGGCASVDALPAGPAERPYRVLVTVFDRPIDLAASRLTLTLNLAAADTSFAELNGAAATDVLAALLGASTDDVDALLDAMRDKLSGAARQTLDTARKAEQWDELTRAHWGAGAATKLRDRVASWLATGMLELAGERPLLQGELSPIAAHSAELNVLSVVGLPSSQAGFASPAFVAWSADADDTVVLGTDLYWSSSRLVTSLAAAPARDEFPEAETVAEALAIEAGCEQLGSMLSAAGADPQLAYDACDATCLARLCADGLAALWSRGRDATSTKPTSLGLTAAGDAVVGEAAEVAGIKGTWVGELKAPGTSRSTGGPLTAALPPAE